MDTICRFVEKFRELHYEHLPPEVVTVTKKEILDFLGVAVAGFRAKGVQELIQVLSELGGSEESTVLVHGGKVPAPFAAQINATMGHSLDYDDVHDAGVIHPAVVVVPTCLAVAEKRPPVQGKELLTVVALGVDMMCRLALALKPGYDPSSQQVPNRKYQTERVKQGWHLTTLMGHLVAAGVAGRLLGLNEEEMVNAFGIAYHQASGNLQGRDDGALTKRMGPGFAVRSGIVSALLAKKGLSGATHVLDGHYGLYKLYFQGGYDPEELTKDLGVHFEGLNVSLKPYPCCRGVHASIDAALQASRRGSIRVEEIEEVTIFVDEGAYVSLCTPLEVKTKPRSPVDAQFSIPWGVAVALAKGNVSVAHFGDTAIKDPEILGVGEKIRVRMDQNLNSDTGTPPGKVEVRLKDGRILLEEVDSPLGSPQRPMSYEECVQKFMMCASGILPAERVERTAQMVQSLEGLDDVRELVKLLEL